MVEVILYVEIFLEMWCFLVGSKRRICGFFQILCYFLRHLVKKVLKFESECEISGKMSNYVFKSWRMARYYSITLFGKIDEDLGKI